ncbi:MAG: Bug family tripartite tricarboxylate transporter substrate binding protein [Bradyrhizobium sp.]|uniref:Bug family tripartite tricarboxylate transporter substrate binding protein n=1 Tax=Bradyrhizobium sp. TaxID=376 RepID=UPI0029BB36E7|nr:Bug family tripartite tricarboxylate transporter substrate binding protein [Bradyrhizobium sp.]MDX3964995.1 Bug family tripartite tricarboxylate transporter substrate binding protein [Bradyrhizobium sp.]
MRFTRIVLAVAGFAMLTLAPPLAAQTRTAPLRIIYPFPGGGSGDALTRLIAERLGVALERPVIVEPRAGAAGRLGVQAVKTAEPDGNTLLATPIAPMAVYQSVYPALDYDPVKDFAPVSQVATFEFGICIDPKIPAGDLPELAAWLKANPDKANFGTPGAGTLPHFFGLMFAKAAGVPLQHIAYKGGVVALTDLMGSRIPIVFLSTNELTELHKSGRIRVLATSGAQRSTFLPDVPTFREGGYDIEGGGWWGFFAPAGTPAATVSRLSGAIATIVQDEDVKARIAQIGLKPTGTSPEEFARIQREDVERWAAPIKASGFKPEQ